MEKSYIITKIYEIRQSAKGWSETYQMFFNKEKALAAAEKLKKQSDERAAAGDGYKTNFRVYEHETGDALVIRTNE